MVKIARCGCTAGACGCVIQADNTTTTCIDVYVSADPGSPDFPIKISADPVVDPAAGNLLSCEPGGLRADMTVVGSICIDFSGNGSPASPLSATLVFDPDVDDCINCGPQGVQLVIDPAVDNALECGVAGLYVASVAGSPSHDGVGLDSIIVFGTTQTTPAVADGDYAVAIGEGAVAAIGYTIAIGAFATANDVIDEGAIAIGVNSLANSTDTIAIGNAASAEDDLAISIGSGAAALGESGIAMGSGAVANTFIGAIAIGGNASAAESNAIAIGYDSDAQEARCVAVGYNATLNNINSTALGANTNTGFSQGIAIGGGTNITMAAESGGIGSIAIGSSDGLAIDGARCVGNQGVAIGGGSATVAGASVSGNDSIAIGSGSSAGQSNSVALGDGVATTNTSQVNTGAKRLITGAPVAAPADADLIASQVSIWVDETGNLLTFKVKYADGTTVKSGSVALV